MKGSKATENKRRRCGLTEQEMEAALLLIQLCGGGGDYSSSISSSSSSSVYCSRSDMENDSTVIDNYTNYNNNNSNPNLDYYRSKSTAKVRRKFRSIIDLYQSTPPLTNNLNKLHGKTITAKSSSNSPSLLLVFGSDKNQRSDFIGDAASVIIMDMEDDHDDDEMESWKPRPRQ